MPVKQSLELWPKVRPVPCCKCPAYFESDAANSYVAVCQKGEGWDTGVDVNGASVVYCPTHAMPRIEWAEEMAYVRADTQLEPVPPPRTTLDALVKLLCAVFWKLGRIGGRLALRRESSILRV